MKTMFVKSNAYGIVDEIEIDDNISYEEAEVLANEIYLEFIQSSDYDGFFFEEEE